MSGPSIDKRVLARNFTAAAAGYDVRATAQARIAQGLVARLPGGLAPGLVVDLGCGTGLLSGPLLERFPDAQLLGVDLAEGMVETCRRRWRVVDRARFVVGDVEDASHLQAGAGLVACSCASQWFNRPADTLRMWAAALAPGGMLACALLVQGSFVELETAYREALGDDFPGLRLWDARTAPSVYADAGLDLLQTEEQDVTAWYASSWAALRSFRQTGATLAGQPGRPALGIGRARRLLRCYDQQNPETTRAAVTYRVQYVLGQRSR